MSDLIDRQAAIDALIRKTRPHDNGDGTTTICVMSERLIREVITDLPTAEKRGEWIPFVDGNYIVWECSECHVESDAWTDYCPICGSRNIEETDEEAYEEALEEFRKNPKTYTLDEVEAELGLTADLSEYCDKLWKTAYEHGKRDAQPSVVTMTLKGDNETLKKAIAEGELTLMPAEIVHCRDCLMHGVCRFEQGLGLDGYCSQAERSERER